MKKLKIFLTNLLLFFVAGFLLLIFVNVGIVTALLNILFKKRSTDYFKDCATEIDILGNVLCGDFFNYILRTKYSFHLFGKLRMTISEVLGLLERDGGLSGIGKLIAKILNKIDKDHCKNSIRDENKR